MIDASTAKPLYVSTDGSAGPYIMVPLQQIAALCSLLDAHKISYWVDEDAVSLNDEPELSVINFSRGTDPSTIQQILDGANQD